MIPPRHFPQNWPSYFYEAFNELYNNDSIEAYKYLQMITHIEDAKIHGLPAFISVVQWYSKLHISKLLVAK